MRSTGEGFEISFWSDNSSWHPSNTGSVTAYEKGSARPTGKYVLNNVFAAFLLKIMNPAIHIGKSRMLGVCEELNVEC